jgi:hypothetical protein
MFRLESADAPGGPLEVEAEELVLEFDSENALDEPALISEGGVATAASADEVGAAWRRLLRRGSTRRENEAEAAEALAGAAGSPKLRA